MWAKDKATKVDFEKHIGNTTLISSNTQINGDISFNGGLQVDGVIVGNVIAEDDSEALVRLSESGVVEGEIRAPNIIVNGKVNGNVYSSSHIELAAKAIVTGHVHYSLIEMVMGAEVNGSLMHDKDPMKAKIGKDTQVNKETKENQGKKVKEALPESELPLVSKG